MKKVIININLPNKLNTQIPFKIANQPPPNQPPPTTSQDRPITPTTTKNPQKSTRISFQDNPYTFEERHARLSEPLEPVNRQASLSEPTYNLYPTLQQDLDQVGHISQNQNTLEINRQILHPRRNRNFQNPRVHFNIRQSPTPTISELSSSKLPETLTLASQHSISNIPSDYLGSTPTSEQTRENPFNPPNTTKRPPYWTTLSYTQGEPNLVNETLGISSDTTLSSLPETLSLQSTPSISQISPTVSPLNFTTNLDARYQEQSITNTALRLDWNTFVAPPPLCGQHQESNRLHNWALSRLQYRQDIHKDIQEHNIQILQQNSLQLKFEITVRPNNKIEHPFPLSPPKKNSSITTSPIYNN